MRKFLLALILFHGAAFAYNQEDNLPVGKYPVIVNGQPVGIVVLQKGQFQCKAGEGRAIMVVQNGIAFVGCWHKTPTQIDIRWEDGDTGHIAARDA